MDKKTLKSYAKLVVQSGINLQKGQEVKIVISPQNAEFAQYLTEEAYKAKASKVIVNFQDETISKLNSKYRSLKSLSTVEKYEEAIEQYDVDKKPCYIYVEDKDPDYLSGVDTGKLSKARQARYPILKPYRDAQDNQYQWVIVALPSVKWAKKIFPNVSDEEAYRLLDDAICKCTRLDGDPIANWEKHKKTLSTKARKMNRYHFDKLTYTSSNGTNLTLGLHPKHVWLSAEETHLGGIQFVANMPTEEVFTMPDKYRVDGKVVSTKALSYQGNLIEDFSIQFKKGKAVKVKAKVGQKYLEEMVKMDDAAAYLGEVALVPFDSPINKTGIMFYNTLFDENACCHLAFGMAFKNNLKGYEKMTNDDFEKENYNDSMIHVDFMIGSEDLKIVGTTMNQEEITVFENGVWAI
ncbi:aminopeptidase [Anaerorhabdus furcosa]|uniref:Aminopeptidase n=1 Tax=Anaerorhabdus furcosa TaxID=118967 RepID=A0A1T4K4F3_9FIRM|nr:aminopeptidase [Anaerorhabdus furcosa]SJZ37318.1 aminopeptidase [Anaerorhabdus furcosa]